MKIITTLLWLVAVLPVNAQQQGNCLLWYDHPATVWEEALPLGNGTVGAMIFGDPAREHLQLNEATFWAGSPHNNDNPKARALLKPVQQMIFAGHNKAAEAVVTQNFVSQIAQGMPYQTGCSAKRHWTFLFNRYGSGVQVKHRTLDSGLDLRAR